METVVHCERCGAQIDDDVAFCTNCGAPITAGQQGEKQSAQSAQSQAGPQGTSVKPPRNKLAIPFAIVAIVAIALIIVLIVMLAGKGNDATSSPSSTPSDSVVSSPAPTIETELFRISLPTDVAEKVSFSETHNSITMGYSDSSALLATIYPASEAMETEAALGYYTLGEVYVGGHYEEARMSLAFLTEDNKTAHAASRDPLECGIEKLLGMTPEEFASCISLNTGSEYEPATAVFTGGRSANASTTTADPVMTEGTWAVPTEPFWGIWTDASKDRAEVEAIAQRIHDQTGDKATVVLTTDWSNLNSEPWYVISMGRWSSQEDANAALPRIQANGYPDAYVKYSGDKIR